MPRRPLQHLLLRDLLPLVGFMALCLLSLSWWGVSRATRHQARAQAGQSLRLLESNLRSRFLAYQQETAELARLWSGGLLDPASPEAFQHGLVMLAGSLQGFRSHGIVRPDGLVLDVGPGPEGWMTGQVVVTPQGLTTQTRRWSPEGRLLGRTPAKPAPESRDARQRPWFSLSSGRWVGPFLLAQDGPFLNTLRVTYAMPVTGQDGRELGVAQTSIRLDDLASLVRVIEPYPGCQVLIADATDHAVLLPAACTASLPDQLVRLERPFSPTYLPLAHELRQAALTGRPLRIGGRRHLVETMRIQGIPGVEWELYLGIPEDVLLLGPTRVAAAMVGFSVLLLAFLVGWIHRTATAFSQPLTALAESSAAMVRGEPFTLPPTRIQEIVHLGEAFGLAGRAIREHVALEAELRHSQRIVALGTMAAGVAHDLNNLFIAIQRHLDVCEHRGGPENHLQRAQTAMDRCTELARAFLTFGRGGPEGKVPLDLDRVIEDALLLVHGILSHQVEFVRELDGDLPRILASPTALTQVLVNLIVNARDAMPNGGQLRIRSWPEEGGVAFAVEDTGVGISPEDRDRVFLPFFTTKEPGKGTGLGLTMVQKIVADHGGRLDMESTPGQGTTFTVHLPA
jgi:signal transduction histidine kinase